MQTEAMIIATEVDINICELFVDDRCCTGTLDEQTLAEALTYLIRDSIDRAGTRRREDDRWYHGLNVAAPADTGLDRFILVGFSARCSSWENVKLYWSKGGLPPEVADAVEELNGSRRVYKLANDRMQATDEVTDG